MLCGVCNPKKKPGQKRQLDVNQEKKKNKVSQSNTWFKNMARVRGVIHNVQLRVKEEELVCNVRCSTV